MTFGTATSDGICGVTSDLSTVPRTQMTHILEDLTHKMVPVNPPKKEISWVLSSRLMILFNISQYIYGTCLAVHGQDIFFSQDSCSLGMGNLRA